MLHHPSIHIYSVHTSRIHTAMYAPCHFQLLLLASSPPQLHHMTLSLPHPNYHLQAEVCISAWITYRVHTSLIKAVYLSMYVIIEKCKKKAQVRHTPPSVLRTYLLVWLLAQPRLSLSGNLVKLSIWKRLKF